MKISFSKILNITLIGIIVVMVSSSYVEGTTAGTATDPLVTLNYVEDRLMSLNARIDERFEALESKEGSSSNGLLAYEVLDVKIGTVINLEENTQVILRAGEAIAIAGVGGGLSDLTVGQDLKTGEYLTKNHLLLIPRTDGRGIKMITDGFVMVSGGYTIE